MKAITAAATTAMMLGLVWTFGGGCARERTYADDRPPTDSLVEGNTGLQAKDVVSATDQMAADLLSLPEVNDPKKPQWTIVITNVDNHTTDPTLNYDVFSQRLRGNLARLGRGRVALIENKAKYHKLQNDELETPKKNEFGEGDGTSTAAPAFNPDFGLYITIDEMPNRASSYFLVTATLTNLSNRTQPWNHQYEVQTAR